MLLAYAESGRGVEKMSVQKKNKKQKTTRMKAKDEEFVMGLRKGEKKGERNQRRIF